MKRICLRRNTNTNENSKHGVPYMKWYHFAACFFMGVFLVNALPHFFHGISGDSFPTPFANPPFKGLSSPLINLVWGFVNLITSFLLYKGSKISIKNKWAIGLLTVGIVAMTCFALTYKG